MENLNPIENPITITCEGSEFIEFEKLKSFQGNLKTLSSKNRDKLARSILKEGFMCPFFVWKNKGKYYLLDGHGRLQTLDYLKDRNWEIPKLPVIYIDAKNKKDARSKLLKITSQYGEFDIDELQEWIDEIGQQVLDDLRLVDKEIKNIFTVSEEPEDDLLLQDYEITVTFDSDTEMNAIYKELKERGYKCTFSG